MLPTLEKLDHHISLGFKAKWDGASNLSQYTQTFLFLVNELEGQVSETTVNYQTLSLCLPLLSSCEYSHEVFSGHLASIQKIVDDLSPTAEPLHLESWVQELNQKIGGVLLERLTQAIELWTRTLSLHSLRLVLLIIATDINKGNSSLWDIWVN